MGGRSLSAGSLFWCSTTVCQGKNGKHVENHVAGKKHVSEMAGNDIAQPIVPFAEGEGQVVSEFMAPVNAKVSISLCFYFRICVLVAIIIAGKKEEGSEIKEAHGGRGQANPRVAASSTEHPSQAAGGASIEISACGARSERGAPQGERQEFA